MERDTTPIEIEKYEEVFELEKEENVSMKEVVVKRLKQKIYFVI